MFPERLMLVALDSVARTRRFVTGSEASVVALL